MARVAISRFLQSFSSYILSLIATLEKRSDEDSRAYSINKMARVAISRFLQSFSSYILSLIATLEKRSDEDSRAYSINKTFSMDTLGWFILKDDQQYLGPIHASELIRYFPNEGTAQSKRVRAEGMSKWQLMSYVPSSFIDGH